MRPRHLVFSQEWDVERGLPRGADPDVNSSTLGNSDRCDSGGDGGLRVTAAKDDNVRQPLGGNDNSKSTGGSIRRVSVARRIVCAVLKSVAVLTVFTVTCAFIWYTMGLPFLLQVIVVAFIAYVASGGYKFIYLVYRTAPRDIK